jgi:DGQHR domain-containing protein
MITQSEHQAETEGASMDDLFDLLQPAEVWQDFRRATIGRTPSGFPKIHADLSIPTLTKLIGYDPRVVRTMRERGIDQRNLNLEIIELQEEVQRTIDQQKVDAMTSYLHAAVSEGAFADWAALELVTASKADTGKYESDHVIRFPYSAEYFITDGQHRFCALLDFARKYPELRARFEQSIAISVLPEDRLRLWAGQSFHDKNYLATPVQASKALAVDSRDVHNRLAKELNQHDVIRLAGGIDDEKQSLKAKSAKFATHSVIYKFVRAFAEGRIGLDKAKISNPRLNETSYDKIKQQLDEYVTDLHGVIPSWTATDRENYLARASAALQALAVVGFEVYTRAGTDRAKRMEYLERLRGVNWRRDNLEWDHIIGQVKDGEGISPASSRQAFDSTIKYLKEKMGLSAEATSNNSVAGGD